MKRPYPRSGNVPAFGLLRRRVLMLYCDGTHNLTRFRTHD